ncbi:hypothetical protein KEM54_001731 [Ascosphaera aggregata]|nr:hypothetical protein KEM54_001731 [Ascosphaera aggregata]
MSLNGLDDPAVQSEYRNALKEPSRWFLLQYTSRDTAALLSSGSGVSQIHDVVEQYTERKPLFGFLNFWSRKVVLKIVPDGTSRLYLVRLSVQFSSVLESFEHDTIYELSSPSELNELSLNAVVFPAGSALPHTPLAEILENDEIKDVTESPGRSPEAARLGKMPEVHLEQPTRDQSAASETCSIYSRERSREPSHPRTQRQHSIQSLRSTSSRSLESNLLTTMLHSSPSAQLHRQLSRDPPAQLHRQLSRDSSAQLQRQSYRDPSAQLRRQSYRDSSAQLQRQPSRDSMTMSKSPAQDIGVSHSRSAKPLGPRPSFDVISSRQRTNSAASNSSLTVSLPSGIRPRNSTHASHSGYLPSPNNNDRRRDSSILNDIRGGLIPPKSSPLPFGESLSSYLNPCQFPTWPPPPGMVNSHQPMRRKMSASALSMRSTLSVASNGTTSTNSTPEKERLMKALHNRRKMQEQEDKKERLIGNVADGDILKAENQKTCTPYVAPQRIENWSSFDHKQLFHI